MIFAAISLIQLPLIAIAAFAGLLGLVSPMVAIGAVIASFSVGFWAASKADEAGF